MQTSANDPQESASREQSHESAVVTVQLERAARSRLGVEGRGKPVVDDPDWVRSDPEGVERVAQGAR